MKKINYLLAMAAVSATALVSCSTDDITTDQPSVNGGEKAYASVRISMGGLGTRADANTGEVGKDFDYGTADENKINSVTLAFYDGSGLLLEKVVASTTVGNPTTNNDPDNVAFEQTYEVEVQKSTSEKAKQLVAYVNMTDSPAGPFSLATTTDAVQSNGFIMTNSAYYNGETAVNTVKITENDFHPTSTIHAPNTTPGSVVDIYVERVAAKVQLDQITEIATSEKSTAYRVNSEGKFEEIALTFTPNGWFVQSTAKKSFLVKNLVADVAWANAPTQFRNYWAEAVNYNMDLNTEINGNLNVVTYKDGADNAETFETSGTSYTSDATSYVQENTFPATRLFNNGVATSAYNPWYDVTAIIVNGEYKFDEDSSFKPDGDGTFYLRSTVVTLTSETTNDDGEKTTTTTTKTGNYIYNTEEAIAAMLKDAGIVVKGAEEGAIFELSLEADEAGTPSQNSAYLVVKEGAALEGVTVSQNGVDIEDLTEEALTQAIAGITPMKKYQYGQAYFAIPLKHYATVNTQAVLPLKEIATGNYGIVRNNWYVLTINKIEGLGTGVGDEDTDKPHVIPETENVLIDVSLKVLQWHMRNQSVDL